MRLPVFKDRSANVDAGMADHLKILKALADETRLRIINLLYERELCVCDLWAILGASQAKISRHLAYLKNAGLVNDQKMAQWSFYTLTKSSATAIVDDLIQGTLRNIDTYKEDLEDLRKREAAGACQLSPALKGAFNETDRNIRAASVLPNRSMRARTRS